MKQFISNGKDIFSLITGENKDYYICNTILYLKSDVITNYHPLDNLNGKLYVFTAPFINY
jgi:hypothetical protein